MAQRAAQRAWEALHPDGENGSAWHDGSFERWSSERSSKFPFHRDDGVTVWVAPVDLTPDDDFLTPAKEPKRVAVSDLLANGATNDEAR